MILWQGNYKWVIFIIIDGIIFEKKFKKSPLIGMKRLQIMEISKPFVILAFVIKLVVLKRILMNHDPAKNG